MLITGPKSGWDNFFKLRCPIYDSSLHSVFRHNDNPNGIYKSKKDMCKHFEAVGMTDLDWLKINKGQAEIHIMDLAEKIYDAYNESTPRKLEAGEWHIPFKDKMNNFDIDKVFKVGSGPMNREEVRLKASVAMAARTSYTTVGEEKTIDYEAMIKLHDRLLAQDPPHSSPLEHCARTMTDEEYQRFVKGFVSRIGTIAGPMIAVKKSNEGWCNNFKGFIPYRYLVDNGN
jgi:hypothetical protein